MVFYFEIRHTKSACGLSTTYTAQQMKFSIKDFFSKCDQIRKKLQNWSHLLKKPLEENLIFCAVNNSYKKVDIHGEQTLHTSHICKQ